jgi:hypothetical protein
LCSSISVAVLQAWEPVITYTLASIE